MDDIKSVWSFLSFIGDVLSPSIEVLKSEDFHGIFNGSFNDDINNENDVKTANKEK